MTPKQSSVAEQIRSPAERSGNIEAKQGRAQKDVG